jgi:transposase
VVLNTIQNIQAQKIRGILNVFGAYDHTNNQMWTHGYRKKTEGKQFLDFIDRIDQKYDNNIKQIFLVLDNVSIHKSNKVKQTMAKNHPRIQLVFLPTRSPELNLIEVRWLWMHIDKQLTIPHLKMNKILVKPCLNGHATITKNMQAKQAVLVYKNEVSMCLHNC